MSMWAIGASVVTTVVASAASASQAKSTAAKGSIAANEAVVEANVSNTIRTGYRMGLANVQHGLQKRDMVQQGYDISKGGSTALGSVDANAAASGSVGASIDAIHQDVLMKVGEARASLENEAEIDAGNFNMKLQDIAFGGEQAVQKARKVDLQSEGSIWGNALAAGAVKFTSSYANQYMNLSPGSSQPSTGGYSLGDRPIAFKTNVWSGQAE